MWDGWIILARVSQIREIFPDELHDVRYVGGVSADASVASPTI
jgi:hypothetical protein